MKRRFLISKPEKEEMNLQITSMADIFMILLVFLLKAFSTGISNITPSNALILPEARASEDTSESLKLEISSKQILLDDHPIMVLEDFRFQDSDLERDGTPRALNTALLKERQRRPASRNGARPTSAEKKQSVKKQPEQTNLAILSDQNTPYTTLKSVLGSASLAGFSEIKLVVVEDR